ncbi:MAG TPA: UDP-N-acetylmuramoyl-tripeptide--D-alanyl-D-alanine ligase [Actinomycetes bacterium]|jgi:UDP-N-acetylmuramoyl-tripeptide--D-alanyl-D-alanine ligase|nr:UDP-N-acetylmuramoyl-tripeptide--D-alanyl-D-alanine ligase [Actinomycetes bacterium]
MIPTTLADVADAAGGRLVDAADDSLEVVGVESDSRKVGPGSLFVALEGTRVDGHDFASRAVAAGALAVLGTRPTGVPTIVVTDVLAALGALARFHVDRLADTTVVAITGSVGKTTAKDLIAAVLEADGPTISPPGSFNNELGLPLTVLSATPDTRYLVLEMGARGRGHIDYLCSIAPPHIGVELMVGTAHLSEFGSREAIADAKAELVRALPETGTAILNADDDLVRDMANQTPAPVLWFGRHPGSQVSADNIEYDALDRASFTLTTPRGKAPVSLMLVGGHAVPNALAAAAVGSAVGMDTAAIGDALSAAAPRSRWRMEITERADGLVVINDAYNASPESMRAALKSLKNIAGKRRSWAVLGEMLELGESSMAEHDAIGRLVVRLDVQRLVVVGEGARPMHLAAGLEGSWGQESVFVPDVESAVALLCDEVRPDDVVLVKASRAAGLEAVAARLLDGETP